MVALGIGDISDFEDDCSEDEVIKTSSFYIPRRNNPLLKKESANLSHTRKSRCWLNLSCSHNLLYNPSNVLLPLNIVLAGTVQKYWRVSSL